MCACVSDGESKGGANRRRLGERETSGVVIGYLGSWCEHTYVPSSLPVLQGWPPMQQVVLALLGLIYPPRCSWLCFFNNLTAKFSKKSKKDPAA